MKISLITVCFNSSETIADTMQSVADQTYENLEHIVVDGASNDGTLDIVRRFPNRLTRVVSERDSGIYDAMNKGLSLATGDFVGFLNADDMLASRDAIARIAAAAGSGIDVVYGDLSYVNKDSIDKVIRYWSSGAFHIKRLRYGWMPPHPTFYIRRSLANALGPFDLRFRIAADYDFMLRCLRRSDVRVAYLPGVLVHMRVGGASNKSMKALFRKSREDLMVLKKNRVGGLGTLFFKNARKLPQFLSRPKAAQT